MARDEGNGSFWAGLIIGGFIGAALALLFAPQAGKELRERLAEAGVEAGERARAIAEQASARARETAEDVTARGRAILEEGTATLQEAIEEGREEASRVARELQSRFEETRRRAAE